jgi:hypothetical protein
MEQSESNVGENPFIKRTNRKHKKIFTKGLGIEHDLIIYHYKNLIKSAILYS